MHARRHVACSLRNMDSALERPGIDPNRSPEDMLSDLEELNDAVLRRLETATAEVRRRYETELVPLLEHARTHVAQRNVRARNVIEDASPRFRTLLASSTRVAPPGAAGRP